MVYAYTLHLILLEASEHPPPPPHPASFAEMMIHFFALLEVRNRLIQMQSGSFMPVLFFIALSFSLCVSFVLIYYHPRVIYNLHLPQGKKAHVVNGGLPRYPLVVCATFEQALGSDYTTSSY